MADISSLNKKGYTDMILFKEDWMKYPKAIADVNTKNQSFVRISALYRDMGIENHLFPLALLNPDLQGIDPFSPDLTLEQKMAIVLECRDNPFYFFREIARDAAGGGSGLPFRASRANMALYWLFFNHVTTLLVAIRQTGKTFSSTALFAYLLNVALERGRILTITKDEKLKAETMSRVKSMDDLYPYYLKQRSKKDVANTDEIQVSSLGNKLMALLSSTSKASAGDKPRGFSAQVLYVDEIAFVPNIEDMLPAATAVGNAARDIAKQLDMPYGSIYTTTAGKKDDQSGRYTYRIIEESASFTEKFFDSANMQELHQTVRSNSPKGKLQVHCSFNHRQLGYTDEWLREKINEAPSTPDKINRDYFGIWTSGSEASPLPIEISNMIRQSEIKEFRPESFGNYPYITRWYITESELRRRISDNSHFIMGIDSSDMAGGDELAMVIRDAYQGDVIAVGNYNSTNLFTFTNWLTLWFTRFENLTLIIERRSTGSMILDQLIASLMSKGINPFKRIFNKVVNNADEKPEDFEFMVSKYRYSPEDVYIRYKKSFGFATSATGLTARSELYGNTFQLASKLTGDKVRDTALIDQLLSLVIRNGRVDHAVGEHDDLCFTGDTLVRTIYGNVPLQYIRPGDQVLTRNGYRRVLAVMCRKAKVITKFGLTGTPDHPFITPNGIIKFKDLTEDTEVYVWQNEKLSSTTVKSFIDTQNQTDIETIPTTEAMTRIATNASHFTEKCISITTDLYQKAITYITSTAISTITPLRIWNAYPPKNTNEDIPCLKNNGNFRVNELKNPIPSLNGNKNIQMSSEKHLPEEEKQLSLDVREVYNLTVDDTHEYFVNDILVHNCISWILSFWLLTRGKNLSYYGIDSRAMLINSRSTITGETAIDEYNNQKQNEYRNLMDEIVEKMRDEKDPYIRTRYEIQLRNIASKIVVRDNEVFSVDELLETLKRERRLNKSIKKY